MTDQTNELKDQTNEPSTISMRRRRIATAAFWIIVSVLPLIGIFFSLVDPPTFYSSQEQARDLFGRFGIGAPIVFVGLQALQVIVTPFSHYSVGYLGGFLFGPVWGSIYNYAGRLIGHFAAFAIARKLASPLIRRYVSDDAIQRFDKHVSNRADVLFLMYFLPLFPDDEFSYVAGLSKMPAKWFVIANVLGQVGGSVSLAYLGSGIDTRDPLFWILTIVTLAGFPLLFILARRQRNSLS